MRVTTIKVEQIIATATISTYPTLRFPSNEVVESLKLGDVRTGLTSQVQVTVNNAVVILHAMR